MFGKSRIATCRRRRRDRQLEGDRRPLQERTGQTKRRKLPISNRLLVVDWFNNRRSYIAAETCHPQSSCAAYARHQDTRERPSSERRGFGNRRRGGSSGKA